MFIKSKRQLLNIYFEHEKRRKQCDEDEDDLKEATGEGLEENDSTGRNYKRL